MCNQGKLVAKPIGNKYLIELIGILISTSSILTIMISIGY
jgi:hypothetical protein